MDCRSVKENLDNYINSLKGDDNQLLLGPLEEFIIKKAKEKNLEIIGFSNFWYIKKGQSPKILLHLNIDDRKEKSSVFFDNIENVDLIRSNNNINLITSALLINYLIEYSDESFDILLTNNNIHIENDNFINLKNIIRCDNVVNLNLRQADCIADEFSALKLFLNQVKVRRFQPEFPFKTYRVSLNGLSGGHAGEEADKVKLNSIKLIIGIIRKIKAKVDIDIISLTAGERYDYIPSQAQVDFIVKDDFEGELLNIFDIVKSESIEKNLKYEPDMNLELAKLEERKYLPIDNESFNHLASFIELTPTGSYFVNSVDEQIVSSTNLATARSLKNYINMIIVLRSLSDESMTTMVDKIKLSSKISSSVITERFNIDKWKNDDNLMTDVFMKSYIELFNRDLKSIKTQFSLDSSIIFKDINVKILSLGVKYKQGDNIYYSSIGWLVELIALLEYVLKKI